MPEILLVDDEAEIIELAGRFLREAGHEVTAAINSDVALFLLERGLGYRLLITDVVLPGLLDGFALAHRARALIPDIKILYTTGYAGVARVRARGGASYGQVLPKPWKRDQLLQTVRALLPRSALDQIIRR